MPGNILQEPGTHRKGHQWKNDAGDLLFIDRIRSGGGQWCSNLFRNDDLAKRPGSYTWENILCRPEPLNAGLKWGTREYNVPHRVFRDCDWFEIPKEHGVYASNYEGTVVDRCTFVRMGSQGVQFAHRPVPYNQYLPDNRAYDAPPIHVLRHSHFIDCGQGGDRPSFNATYFDPGSSEHPGTLLVRGCSFVADWADSLADTKSTGALVVTPMGGAGELTSNFMKLVEIRNTLFDFTAGDRSIVSIRSTDEVVIEDCTFIARDHRRANVDIDAPVSAMGTSKSIRIVLRNCVGVGGVRLRVFQDNARGWSDNLSYDIHCPGQELVIDGRTGELIHRRGHIS